MVSEPLIQEPHDGWLMQGAKSTQSAYVSKKPGLNLGSKGSPAICGVSAAQDLAP